MACTFVNLHLHTEIGSPLDGFARIPDIIKRSKELDYDAIAVTDHGSMSAILSLYNEGKKNGIRIIPGIEIYCVDDRTKRVKGEPNRHLVLLAKNKEGYQNLLKLNFEAYETGSISVYDRVVPRVDLGLLAKYGKGVIATSACLVGTIPVLLKEGKKSEAITLVETYKEIFDEFYLEVQPTFLIGRDQKEMNKKIEALAKKTKTSIVVALDSHYVYLEDREYHHVLLAVQSKRTIHDDKRLFFEATPLLSEEDILKEFPQEYIDNTRKIADQCEPATYIEPGEDYKIPPFPIPEDEDFERWEKKVEETGKYKGKSRTAKYLRYKIQGGMKTKLVNVFKKDPTKREVYMERLKEELEVIEGMNFTEYFLIVGDMLEFCTKRSIAKGVGRGSAAGCLLSFLLDITKVDPIKYGLLFSRFLNKDRISMPDIDSDICQSKRDEVKQYLIEKYGVDKVASIATFGTMKVRACVKDVVRSLELGGNKSESFRLGDKISKSIPDDNPDITFQEAYDKSEDFRNFCEIDLPYLKGKKLKDALIKFEGLTRQMGIHAAGVIISTTSLAETMPMIVRKDVVATAYDGPTLENAGYLKIDVLGLKSLDVIEMAKENVKNVYNKDVRFYLRGLDYDAKDPKAAKDLEIAFNKETNEDIKNASKTFHLYRGGKTSACFQVSGQGMQGLLRNAKPNTIDDVAAVLALFRPGPLGSGMTQEYADRKNGRKQITYPHPLTEKILEDTYGVLCYQEQVMRMATDVAGFTMSEADTLRKAVGKKIKKLMEAQESKFMEGSAKKNVSEEVAKQLWGLIVKFAEYGFNKSHSVSYALTSYQMVFLKANYPAAFWAAALSLENDEKKRTMYMSDIGATRRTKKPIKLLPVDVNKSRDIFICESKDEIRRDLTSLKGVGVAAVEDLMEKAPYKNIMDFFDRVDTKRVNARVVKVLIRANALTSLSEGLSRKTLETTFEDYRAKLKAYKKRHKLETVEGSSFDYNWDKSLHEILEKKKAEEPTFEHGDIEWTDEEIRGFEEEIYGMAISSHVFDSYKNEENLFITTYSSPKGRGYISVADDFEKFSEGQSVVTMVHIKAKKQEIKCRNGKVLRNFYIEDRDGNAELAVFEEEFNKHKDAFKIGKVVQIMATVTKRFGSYKKLTFLSGRRGNGMLNYFPKK